MTEELNNHEPSSDEAVTRLDEREAYFQAFVKQIMEDTDKNFHHRVNILKWLLDWFPTVDRIYEANNILEIEFLPGTGIDAAGSHAYHLQGLTNKTIFFSFNGTKVLMGAQG